MRDPENANTGFDDQAKYIHRGPDGRGGTVSVFKTGDLHTKVSLQATHDLQSSDVNYNILLEPERKLA